MNQLDELLAAFQTMDDRAREQQVRLAKRAAADWPRDVEKSNETQDIPINSSD